MAEQVKQPLKIDVRAAVNAVQIYFQSIQDLIGSGVGWVRHADNFGHKQITLIRAVAHRMTLFIGYIETGFL